MVGVGDREGGGKGEEAGGDKRGRRRGGGGWREGRGERMCGGREKRGGGGQIRSNSLFTRVLDKHVCFYTSSPRPNK